MVGAVVAQIAAVTVAPLMSLLRTSTPTPTGLAVAAATAIVAGLLARWFARPRVAEKE